MPLTVIKGPPNSGRTDLIQARYLEMLKRNPVLVVPGVDDIFAWERRLTRETGALIDGQILHFKDLYSEIHKLGTTGRPREASELHRRHLVAKAIRAGWPRIAGRLADQPGLVDAVLREIDDFRNETIDPETLESLIKENELPDLSSLRHLLPLVEVYRAYMESLGSAGLTDGPNEAIAAKNALSGADWSRPALFAGFDELTPLQLEVISKLAFSKGTDVTVSVSHDPDNPALELTDRLIAQLEALGPESETHEIPRSRPETSPDHNDLLFEVQKRFMQPGSRSGEPLENNGALTIMNSTGERNEAEAIASEIARLVAGGAEPDQIAVAVAVPAVHGRVLRDTLARYSIPVSLECETPVAATTIGRTVVSLLAAASPGGSVDDLLGYLRSPVGPAREDVDEFERDERIRGGSSARESAARLKLPEDAPLFMWEESVEALSEASPINDIVAKVADEASRRILESRGTSTPDESLATESMAASAIARACDQLSELGDGRGTAAALSEAVASGVVKIWVVASRGTVRVASPYSLRSKRFEHLFYASLQEAGLSDTDRPGPFLAARERGALGLSERRDPEVQQRYLFYSCLTVPTETLWLSCRDSDETGKPEQPSPLIRTVEELYSKDGEGRAVVNRGGRSGSAVTFDPVDAPSENELARALASATFGGSEPGPLMVELETELAERAFARLEAAAAAEARTRRLADLTLEPILAALGEHAVFAATEIEAYAGCPYRWFIERQLRPASFEPDPDYLATGKLIHGVLEDLYSAHPGEIPRPGSLSTWLGAVPGAVDARAATRDVGLAQNTAAHAALRSRAGQLIERYLRSEADRDDPRHLPWKLEADFGRSKSVDQALDMDGWALVGVLDRIDLSPETGTEVPRQAVVVDYKSGKVDNLTYKKAAAERTVQVQLYLHAVREIWGAEPVAGIYVPIRADDSKSRGAWDADLKDEMLDRGASKEDKLDDLDPFINEGIKEANSSVFRLMKGLLDHDPALCPHHFDHPSVPDRPRAGGDDSNGTGGGR